jgi:hypothetical protein
MQTTKQIKQEIAERIQGQIDKLNTLWAEHGESLTASLPEDCKTVHPRMIRAAFNAAYNAHALELMRRPFDVEIIRAKFVENVQRVRDAALMSWTEEP